MAAQQGPAVTPATVNFAATGPGTLPSVLGAPITTYTYTGVAGGGAGTLSVSATGFAGGGACASIPISAMTVTCASAKSSLTCATVTCAAGSQSLTTAGVTVASGTIGGGCTPNITITLNYNFADNWKYTAETCTLLVTYNAS
jgi:hypothetical protein